MLRVYRLRYKHASRPAPPLLWEWEQPHIHHLLLSARTFGHRVVQRYLRDREALCRVNARLWQQHYRPRPLYDHLADWQAGIEAYRQLVVEVQAIAKAQTDEDDSSQWDRADGP